jgi:hypothetical protein
MTGPTNLYDQNLFPSLDYTLSFHLGLFIRVSESQTVLDATQSVVIAFGQVAIRFESRRPDRCPKCGSYKIGYGYDPEPTDQPHFLHCEKCSLKNMEGHWRSEAEV